MVYLLKQEVFIMPKKVLNIDNEILDLLNKYDTISFIELSKYFSYSLPVIRKMCQNLAEKHNIECFRGYIKYFDNTHYNSNPIFKKKNKEKKAIAKRASEFIKNGDTIFVGAGSTTSYMCRYLRAFKSLTVITNSIPIMNELMHMPHITAIIIGGILQLQDQAIVGEFSEIFIRNFHASKIFLGTEGLSINKGASRSVIQKNMTESTISTLEGQKIILADHTKFGQIKTWAWLPIENIDTVITDSNISPDFKKQFSKNKNFY